MKRLAVTENGQVWGVQGTNSRITVFKGIPFAAPPVGENRWRAPQPASNWEGIRDCSRFAPISVQDTPGIGNDIYIREWHVDSDIPMDEDCLYLNVWTPAKDMSEKHPVLVWFFGGGFQWGYPAEMEFDGEHLAAQGIVVVSVNYRLAALGFLAHPELTREQPDAPSNFGLMDQQAGLHWVKRNIAAFGGDPDKITIAGQSAGGASTLCQLTNERNYGVISGAVIFSGLIRSPYGFDAFIVPQTLEIAEQKGVEFFKYLGVNTLEEARKLDPYFIRAKYGEYAATQPRFSPCIDGNMMKYDTYDRILNNDYANVPVIAGNTEDEFTSSIFADNDEALEAKARECFGNDADKYLAFDEARRSKVVNMFGTEARAYGTISGIELSAKKIALADEKNNGRNTVYYYRFRPDIPGWDNPGTFHSSDLWFFFDNVDKCWRPFTGRHYDLARQMSGYLVNFIKTGDPNGKDKNGFTLPAWRPVSSAERNEMEFTADGAVPNVDTSEYKTFLIKHIK